jgi:hypothetical protein
MNKWLKNYFGPEQENRNIRTDPNEKKPDDTMTIRNLIFQYQFGTRLGL